MPRRPQEGFNHCSFRWRKLSNHRLRALTRDESFANFIYVTSFRPSRRLTLDRQAGDESFPEFDWEKSTVGSCWGQNILPQAGTSVTKSTQVPQSAGPGPGRPRVVRVTEDARDSESSCPPSTALPPVSSVCSPSEVSVPRSTCALVQSGASIRPDSRPIKKKNQVTTYYNI